MYACILIPRELSLVLTLHPNSMRVLEMSATLWSNTNLTPGTIFYPDEGEVRLERIDSRVVIPEEDIRRFYGCYDAIMHINGQEVRHCNWVRFVKTTSNPNDANIISSKVRGQAFYQVIKPVKPNEEIIVLFHMMAERSMSDRLPHETFGTFSQNMVPSFPYFDNQAKLIARYPHDIKSPLISSTPVSSKIFQRDSYTEDPPGPNRSLKFGSSSSSSSFASPQLDTHSSFHSQRGIPHESSFTSPICTSSSSRETSTSDNYSRSSPVDTSLTKDGSLKLENVSDYHESERRIPKKVNTKVEGEGQACDYSMDQSREVEVDVVNETSQNNDDNDCGRSESESFISDEEIDVNQLSAQHPPAGEDTVKALRNQVSGHRNSSAPTFKLQEKSTLSDSPDIIMKTEIEDSSDMVSKPSEVTALAQSMRSHSSESMNDKNLEPQHDDSNNSHHFNTTDNDGRTFSVENKGRYSIYNDSKANETEQLSSPAETRPDLYKLPLGLKSARKLNLQQPTGALDQVRRCRERTWWPCDVCGKKFDRPSLLKRHTRTHTGEKPHACDVCGKAFSTSSSLNTHKRIHSGEKPHQCKTCGKRFTASSNLYYHRMTHNKEKPHKCDTCSKSFPTPGDLRSHMYIHNGSWPFRCDVCNRGFSKQTNLKNHMLLHTGDKPHECGRCDKKFALLCNLKTHLKIHDNTDSSDCGECLRCGVTMETTDDVHDSICKRCFEDSCKISKSAPSSSPLQQQKQRHTDFSISKLTSTDVKEKRSLFEAHYTPTSQRILDGNFKTRPLASLPQPASHYIQVPTMYSEFFTQATDPLKWMLPTPSPILSTTQFLPTSMKTASAFHSRRPQPQIVTKMRTANHAHSGIPAFMTPEMALRGTPVFSSAAGLPPGFPMNQSSRNWNGHVSAQGFS